MAGQTSVLQTGSYQASNISGIYWTCHRQTAIYYKCYNIYLPTHLFRRGVVLTHHRKLMVKRRRQPAIFHYFKITISATTNIGLTTCQTPLIHGIVNLWQAEKELNSCLDERFWTAQWLHSYVGMVWHWGKPTKTHLPTEMTTNESVHSMCENDMESLTDHKIFIEFISNLIGWIRMWNQRRKESEVINYPEPINLAGSEAEKHFQ